MTRERLDPRAVVKVSGPSWQVMRPTFDSLSEALLAVSPTTRGELTTIYVKYLSESKNQPYAVIWLKKASEVTLGLALPEGINSPEFVDAPKGCKYAGLTRYLVFRPGDQVPDALTFWAVQSYDHVTECNTIS